MLEALIPISFKSQRAIAARLNVNKNLIPKIVANRLKFNELSEKKVANSLRAIGQSSASTLSMDEQSDNGLEESALLFEESN